MDKAAPLISVIIPCYNVASYVETAIQSILQQTHSNLEIFIIDDASTDNTLEKINSFKDERIEVITFKENTQKVGAVNEVLKKVKGDYIAFQDSDDWSEPIRIREQLNEFLKDTDLGICFTKYRYFANKAILPKKISLTYEDLRNEFLDYNFKRDNGSSPTICGTMMISKAALKKTVGYHPYFAGRVAEDIQWIYRILKDFKGITINKALYNYRLRQGSFTQVQSIGIKPKYAYSWQLLSKIIYKDIHEGIDVLAHGNENLLKELELEACEEALIQNIQLVNETRRIYENSLSFRIGKFITTPVRMIKKINN
jgi:glycosyltransferase involved in cell wall biosynthesis